MRGLFYGLSLTFLVVLVVLAITKVISWGWFLGVVMVVSPFALTFGPRLLLRLVERRWGSTLTLRAELNPNEGLRYVAELRARGSTRAEALYFAPLTLACGTSVKERVRTLWVLLSRPGAPTLLIEEEIGNVALTAPTSALGEPPPEARGAVVYRARDLHPFATCARTLTLAEMRVVLVASDDRSPGSPDLRTMDDARYVTVSEHSPLDEALRTNPMPMSMARGRIEGLLLHLLDSADEHDGKELRGILRWLEAQATDQFVVDLTPDRARWNTLPTR